MLDDHTHNQARAQGSSFAFFTVKHLAWRWHVAALASIGLVFVALALIAERVSAHEEVRFGTIVDSIYVGDGFYKPEESVEHGPYRWTHPLGLLTLRDWGPGRIHVSISGVGATPSEALLKIDGEPVGHTDIEAGQPWKAQGWGMARSRNPVVSLEGPAFKPANDARTLGRLVTHLEVYAPEARTRAWINLGLLSLAALLLYSALFIWFGRTGLALMVGTAFPAVFGPLAIYRDKWMDSVAWVAPVVLTILLLATWKLKPPGGEARHFRWTTALICAALTAALFLLAQGFLNAFDSERMYQVTAGLAEYGLPTRYPGRDTWTKYGFGQSLLAVPFYLLGKLGVAFGGDYATLTRFAVSLTNLPLTALTCWLLYRAGRRFASVGVSLALAATYLLTTPALNYARTFFSEPAGAALLLAALLLLVPRDGERMPSGSRIALAGACLGVMIWLKPAFVIYWFAPGTVVLALAARGATSSKYREASAEPLVEGGQKAETSAGRSGAMRSRAVVIAGLLFAIGPVVAGIVQLGYNYLRYGDVRNGLFRTGYEREPGFSTPLLEGLGGLLFSPGKSLFLYAPALILAPLGLWLMYRRGSSPGRLAAILILTQTVVSLIFNALWWAWTGNFAWGPRLIIPVLPLLALPLASVGEWASGIANYLSKAVLAAWVALAILGGLVSIPGALVDFQVYYRLYGLELAGDPGEEVTIYSVADSPLLVESGYLLNGLTASMRRPNLSDAGLPDAWDVLVPASLAIFSLLATWVAARIRKKT
jgi:hypothetical protein